MKLKLKGQVRELERIRVCEMEAIYQTISECSPETRKKYMRNMEQQVRDMEARIRC